MEHEGRLEKRLSEVEENLVAHRVMVSELYAFLARMTYNRELERHEPQAAHDILVKTIHFLSSHEP